MEDKPFIAPALETTGVLWTLQRDFIGKLGSWASAALTAFAGLMVILSTILPTSIDRAHALHILAPKHLIQFSFSLSLTFGILLFYFIKRDLLWNKTVLLYDHRLINWCRYF
ncbi:hypothetical protein ACUC2M_18640 [Bacillus cytotoxicus]